MAFKVNPITGKLDYYEAAGEAEAHTIASHSDTSGTGPELDELTDGSETALHIHDTVYQALTTVGIADNNLVEIDHAAVEATDYAKFTANGLEGREASEVLSDIGVVSGADVTGSNAPQAHKGSHENTGGDEISVAGLSGLLADDQHVLDTEVESVITAEIVGGQSIDNAIDALISTHATPNLFYSYKTSQQTLGTSYADITGYASSPYDDSAYSFNTTTGILTIDTAGIFLLGFGVFFNLGSGTRMHAYAQLHIDTGSGYAVIPGMSVAGYGRTVDEGTSGACVRPIALSSGDLIKMLALDIGGDGEINSDAEDGTYIWAHKIG